MLLDHHGAGPGTATRTLRRPVRASAPGRPRVASRPQTRPWESRYSAALHVLDLTAAVAATGTVLLVSAPDVRPGLLLPAAVMVLAWPALLAGTGAHDGRVFGTGSDEFRGVGRAGFLLLALSSFVSYVAQLDLSRALVLLAVPTLTVLTLAGRYGARLRLRRLRARGACTKRVVVVGRGGAVTDLAARLRRDSSGLEVVAACVTPDSRSGVAAALRVPVSGLDDVAAAVARHGADTVAVTSASETAAEYLRRLSWQLEGTGTELLVAPGLIEVAGPRLHIRPFEGLPLLSVEQPRFEGWRRVVKGGVDRATAALALVFLTPVLLVIALAVRLDSPGPVLYRQERVGVNGRGFTILKFRSMAVDADRRLAELLDRNEGDGLLFKMRRDPRVTRVGRWLRRFSLDELPQLLNVLGGSMSLVGPRPPLPAEVERYDSSVSRRLLVRPGLTGLWQISGRSDLSWEEAVRLDLRYVENWSLALDALILVKTVRAVVSSSGAY
ncbi:sugar transferase [Geodermatophilus amargosae]|uniref:sugar transferase n=1 Tax=Geodermatophilus amargosae TaxID=1296565 RepID=UPI0034E046AC